MAHYSKVNQPITVIPNHGITLCLPTKFVKTLC